VALATRGVAGGARESCFAQKYPCRKTQNSYDSTAVKHGWSAHRSTAAEDHLENLFEPLDVGGLSFKNRIVHLPTTMNMSDPLGHVTPKIVGAYETLAHGGYSAVVVGATCVRHDGLINERMLGIYDDTYVIGLRDLVEVIKNNNALAGIQLFYGGLIPGLGSTVALEPGKGWIPGTVAWGPSNKYAIGNAQPAVVTTELLDELVETYAQGARRAREAGFEFVGFHFCHGSLPHTMLSLLSNSGRTDKYADRFLFCESIIRRTQQLCGKDYPIMPRLCCDENLEGGYDIDYFAAHYAPRLHALGIAVLDCTFGSMLQAKSRRPDITSNEFIGPSFYTPKAVNLENVVRLKKCLRAAGIDMPLVGSANLTTPQDLRAMTTEGAADFAGVCRLSLDDPDFPNKMLEGREDEIRMSTHTGAALLQGNIFGKGWAGSAQNASFGRDRAYRIVPTLRPRKVVIVGGGSGGMEYALTARQIGHDVVLFERRAQLGGAMDWAGNYPTLRNMDILRYQPQYHRTMMARLGIEVRTGIDAGVEAIVAEKPDVVVIATGARAIIPDVIGVAQGRRTGRVLTMDEVMDREAPRDPGSEVVVYGAGAGAELALDLRRRGKRVRLLDPGAAYVPANYIGSRGAYIIRLLAEAQIRVETLRKLSGVSDRAFTFTSETGEPESVEADSLILTLGRVANSDLVRKSYGKGVAVHVVGDTRSPRSFGNAIHEAAYLARQI
jgi:2,4-dienoyl-CoA reductase-like NADH-dependent reductase (Old Yellow Enzyme family)/thioredoxin reductase